MKKRILSLLLAFLMIFGIFPSYTTYAVETEKPITVTYFNTVAEAMEEAEIVELYRGGEMILSASLRDDISGDMQWQIEAKEDLWVDIQGGTGEELRISYGMVKSLLSDDAVRMRCIVSDNEVYCSDPFTVMVTDVDNRLAASSYVLGWTPIASDPLSAPIGVPNETEPVVDDEAEPEVTEETESVPTEETESVPTEETESVPTEETESVPTEETESVPTEETESVSTEETEPASTEINDIEATEETLEIRNEVFPLASSSAARIMLLSSVTPAEEPAVDSLPGENTTIYTVTIEYVYADGYKFAGQRVALPYVYEATAGQTINVTVPSPNCIGYSPDKLSINLAEQGAINGNINLTVKYTPAQVSYTVRHYLQNVDNDEYTWVDTTLATGYTEANTSDSVAKSYEGFTALSHYHEEIAADSSTTIDIYYDRNYYLMSFDLNGGHGVNAIYARYGADVSVADPQRAGYNFSGWSLDRTNAVSLPDTMPAYSRTYIALWNSGNTTYTIAYWLENADANEKYDFVGSVPASANSGDSVSGNDSAVAEGIFSSNERQYYAYNSDKTNVNVTVAGDGSSVVNVYYDRNEYTLKFYYARLEGTTYDIAYSTNNSSASGGTAASAGWVGNFTTKPTWDSKYIEQSEVINGNTYYYFTITAKYGASLSDLWPNAPLTSAGNYNFISWGTHYGSGYYNANSNKNIKGVYSLMDSGLLIDPTVTADQGVNHWMVGYWNTNPTMYTYEVYYSVLKGETAERTYNNVEYKKVAKYTVGSTDKPSGQTALSFDGVTSVGKDYDSDEKKDGAAIRFYYQRIEHTVTFNDSYGTITTYTLPYGATLSSYMEVPTPEYPNELPVEAYEFGGWYQSKDGVGALDTGITMPNKDMIYYAKWNPIAYTVTINDGNGKVLATQQIGYGAKAVQPTEPTMEDATFIGWYYKDTSGEERRFDFDNITITRDTTIYAKWRSNVMKKVTVRYVVVNDRGDEVAEIADAETVMLRVGSTRTFAAKTGVSLYENYRTGCFPTTASHSITPTAADSEIVYEFQYKQIDAVPYQVEYKVMMDDNTSRPAFLYEDGKAVFVAGRWDNSYTEYVENHNDNNKAVVTELYIPSNLKDSAWTLPDAYVPNALKIQKVIIPDEDNTITFIYRYAPTEALYTVNHYIQNATDQTKYDLYSFAEYSGTIGENVAAAPISIPGHTYSKDVTESKMASGNALTDEGMTGTVNAQDTLELNFYYTVRKYPYHIMYLEKGTNRVLLETKTVDADNKPLTDLYGAQVSYTLGTPEEKALLVDYDVDEETKSIYIQMEAGNTANVNTIVFYYTRKSADLIISKTVELDAEQAREEGITAIPEEALQQEFVFTIYCPTGFHKSVYDYTLTEGKNKTEGTVIAGTTTMTLRLKSGQAAAIHDLAMGEYTVTETYVPGFRTSVNDKIQQSCTVKLNRADQNVTTPFVNTYPFYTGDLVVKKEVVKLDNSDPGATEPYQVRVTLTPEDAAREVDRVITWTDSNGAKKNFTVPKLTGSEDQKSFNIDISVPTGGEVKMEGVPVGSFKIEELTSNDIGYITDYYKVTYNKAQNQNNEVKGIYDAASGITGEIHGGHPTAVTFTNTYKKGSLTILKTVTQEYEKDSWKSDTFTFQIIGTTELPDGTYTVEGATVAVSDGKVTVKDASGNDPTITVTRTDGATSWNDRLTFTNLPAGYYTVKEISSTNGLDKYTTDSPAENLLVNDTANPTEAKINNQYKRHYADLTITTTCADNTQSFLFDVSATNTALGHVSLTVVLVGNDSQTIKDLPLGDYTITEKTEWSWREADVTSQNVKLRTNSETVTFDFGEIDRIYWLNGYSYGIREKGDD